MKVKELENRRFSYFVMYKDATGYFGHDVKYPIFKTYLQFHQNIQEI